MQNLKPTRPRSEKQIRASRENGARSRGPITPQGKRNSSRNATRHGLLSRTVILPDESEDRFQLLRNGFMDEFQPYTQAQNTLVETLATARWRQLRAWGAQKTALDRGMADQDPAARPPQFLLLRYEIAFDRKFNRALSHLLAR